MSRRTPPLSRLSLVAFSVCAAWCLGCAGGNYAKVLGEKEQLVARVRDESHKSDSLKSDLVEANRRAADAERALAQVLEPGRAGAQAAAVGARRSRLSFDGDESDRRAQAPLSPRYARRESGDADGEDAERARPRAYALAAKEQPFLRYDARSDAALYVGEVRFDRDERLDESSRRRLMELATFLKTPEAGPWHVDIVGFDQSREDRQRHAGKARASAVADCLWSHGVSRKRMTIDSEIAQSPDEEGRDGANKRKIEIALVPAESVASSRGEPRARGSIDDDGDDWTPVER